MTLNYTVTLTGGTDNGTYTIYYNQVDPSNIATIYGSSTPATNLTLSQVQSGVIVTIPASSSLIIFVNDNPNFATDCGTNQVVYNIVPDATQPPTATPLPTANPSSTPTATQAPTPEPTPNPTPEPTPDPTPAPTGVEATYKFCQCGGEGTVADSAQLQFNTGTCIYLTATQLGGVPSAGDTVFMSDAYCYEYDSMEQGNATSLTVNNTTCVCATPEPSPEPTPNPTPVELRNLKFEHCTDIETSPLSEEVTTENAQLNLPIYLTATEYGSTPSLGDTLRVDVGDNTLKCYEYVGIEEGPWSDSYSIVNTSCTCPPPEPTPPPTGTQNTYYITTPSRSLLQLCAANYNLSTVITCSASSIPLMLGETVYDEFGDPFPSDDGTVESPKFHAITTLDNQSMDTLISPWSYIQIDQNGIVVDVGTNDCDTEGGGNPY
jgi:hypothetical protein